MQKIGGMQMIGDPEDRVRGRRMNYVLVNREMIIEGLFLLVGINRDYLVSWTKLN